MSPIIRTCRKVFYMHAHQLNKMTIRRNVQTVGTAMEKWETIFCQENVSEPESSIKNIMSQIFKLKNLEKINGLKERQLTEVEHKKFQYMCSERLKGKPVQYILGEWDFSNMTLDMKEPVFIPRPETEDLALIAKDKINNYHKQHVQILDIGCGTGCISLDILKSCDKVHCTSIDKNPAACKLTKQNSENLFLSDRLEVIATKIENGNICRLERKKFDFIISNPPYIPSKDVDCLSNEIIRFEDRGALDGGEDGLDVVRDIIQYAKSSLCKNGSLIMEVGLGQPLIIKEYVSHHSDNEIRALECNILKDFTKRDRFVELSKK